MLPTKELSGAYIRWRPELLKYESAWRSEVHEICRSLVSQGAVFALIPFASSADLPLSLLLGCIFPSTLLLSLSLLYCLPRDMVLHWLPGWYTCSHSTHHLLDLNNSPYNHSLPHYSASFAIVSPLLCFVSSQSRNADFLKCVFPPVLPYFSPMIQIITLASATSLSLDNLPVYSSLFLTQTYSTYATCLES